MPAELATSQVSDLPRATAGAVPAADRRADRGWVAGCLVLALLLRLYRLDYQSLWYDEVLTFLASSISPADLWSRPFDPNVPPLYYGVIHALLPLGRSELLLRLPSVLFGVLTVPLLYSVARDWLGAWPARVAALLAAVSPLHVWYSQEARPYALLLALGLLTLFFAQRLLAKPHAGWATAGFVLAGAATFYCHTVAPAFLLVVALYVWNRAAAGERVRWLVLFGVMGVLCLPALARLLLVPPATSAAQRDFQAVHVGYALWTFLAGYSFGPSTMEIRTQGLEAVRRDLAVIVPASALAGVLLMLGLRYAWRRRPADAWLLTAWVTLPLLFAAGGAMLTSHPFNVRYALLAFPGFLLLLGAGAAALGRLGGRAAVAALILGVCGPALAGYYWNPKYHRENVRGAVRYLNQHAAQGDLVIISAPYMIRVLEFYGLREDMESVGYPPAGTLVGAPTANGPGADPTGELVDPARLASSLDAIASDRRDVWLVLSRTFHSDPQGHVSRYFASRYLETGRFESTGVKAVRYRRDLPPAAGPE